jgi:hypothetical protein
MDWSLWLNEYYKDELARTEAACVRGEPAYDAFKWIDDPYLWNVLLWKEYDGLIRLMPGRRKTGAVVPAWN